MFHLIAFDADDIEIAIVSDLIPSRSSARRARRRLTWQKGWHDVRCVRVTD